jgi:hypothetical protein
MPLKVLAMDGCHVKAKFRLAKAQFRLSKPSEALKLVQELLGENPKDRLFQELCGDCERIYYNCERTIKEKKGHYGLPAMRTAAHHSCSSSSPFLDAKVELSDTIS